MSITRKAIHRGVMPLFRLWHDAVGPTVAKKTRVCVIGGLYWEAKGLRQTPDVDIFVEHNKDVNRFQIRDLIAVSDHRFTASTESRCGVMYRETPNDPVVTYDIVDEEVGMSFADVVAREVLPLPSEKEAIIMKLFSGADRLKSRREKAVRDFDDAMKLANDMDKKGDEVVYANEGEKTTVKMVFDSFYAKCVAFKEELPKGSVDAFFWTEEEWKSYLKTDAIGEIGYENDAEKEMVQIAFNAFYGAYKKVMSEEEWKAYLKLD
ncbi:hypothetical protein CPC08DRAFT_728639 [Agrocybe pediades]|nr:hypothetical protein CPC08DRAFT_728639 [Agrocybe pediades]